MKADGKTESSGILPRISRFLQKPWPEKIAFLRYRWDLFLSGIPALIRLSGGTWFLARNDGLGSSLLKSDFENNERAFVEWFLEPGMIALDLGAHQGYYALLAAKRVGRSGRVIAFEPSPRERWALRLNLILNRCINVTVAATALGCEETEADLY